MQAGPEAQVCARAAEESAPEQRQRAGVDVERVRRDGQVQQEARARLAAAAGEGRAEPAGRQLLRGRHALHGRLPAGQGPAPDRLCLLRAADAAPPQGARGRGLSFGFSWIYGLNLFRPLEKSGF